jgi:hypothetical protein
LSDVVDAGLGIISIQRLQEKFIIQNNLHHLIIFPAEHLLLPLLYYPIGIDTSFEKILKGFDCVLRWRLACRSYVRDRRSEEVDEDGRR